MDFHETYSGRRWTHLHRLVFINSALEPISLNWLPARKSGTCYSNVSGWLSGWLCVTLRYYINTATSIWKPFRPSERHIIILSWDPCADIQFYGEPLHLWP